MKLISRIEDPVSKVIAFQFSKGMVYSEPRKAIKCPDNVVLDQKYIYYYITVKSRKGDYEAYIGKEIPSIEEAEGLFLKLLTNKK